MNKQVTPNVQIQWNRQKSGTTFFDVRTKVFPSLPH